MKLIFSKINGSWKACVLLVAALFITQSCKEDFLDVRPQGQQPEEDFWVDEADATRAANAMYAKLREWPIVAFAPIAIESLGADEAEKGSSPSDATFLNGFDTFTAPSTDGQIADFWSGEYQIINLANQVIDHVPDISMGDEGLRARYIAEAKFLRAFAYFRLVRAFGGVPLRLSVPSDPAEYNLPRAAKEEVYAAIEEDLTDAAAVLPTSYTGSNIGRATKGAALGLHAKVALYQQKWADVVSLTDQVKALGIYCLFPNYYQLFRTANENSCESLFEIQASIVAGNPGASNSQFSQVQGARGVQWGGWGFNVPTQALYDAYEVNDPRRDATIMRRGTTTPSGDAVPGTVENPYYNMKSYVPSSEFQSGYTEGAQQNVRVLRYADILLMNAEANNELGNSTAALASLELVRARARAGNNTLLPPVVTTDKTALRNAIYHERRVELAMEFDRYFDVIRQGRGAEVFGSKGWVAGKNEVWPIPQTEIDLSAGLLTQNPGY
jgi:starch-binding outer membrane protein, SusD/RagB family